MHTRQKAWALTAAAVLSLLWLLVCPGYVVNGDI